LSGPRSGQARGISLRFETQHLFPRAFERMEFMIAGRLSRISEAIDRARAASRLDRATGPESSWHPSSETMTPVQKTVRSQDDGEPDRTRFGLIADQTMTLTPGRRLGPYRLLERLGQGGQGEVWKTRRVEPESKLVALKVLKPELAHNPARKAQFRREAQRGLRLTGPSLLAAYELREIDGFHCMAMPFVECTSLRDVIKWRLSYRSGEEAEHLHPFVGMSQADYRRAIAAALAQAARALAVAHERLIVHRDVKPANLLLENRRESGVYLCDFGLGRDLDVATCDQMRDGAGTPIYMAPERLLMFAADEIKCDIYSMGVTLFEALLLEKPFRVPPHVTGPSVAPYLATIEPKSVREIDPDFPEELETVITKAMARDPARRFDSAGDLAGSLEEFVTNGRSGNGKSDLARESRLALRGPHAPLRRESVILAHAEADSGWPGL
jgi:eukaryotic-like serine/threonine-protein kinase